MNTAACFSSFMGPWCITPEVLTGGLEAWKAGRLPVVVDPSKARMDTVILSGLWSQGRSGDRLGPVDVAGGGRYVRHAHGLATIALRGTLMKGPSKFGGTSTVAARAALRAAGDDPAVKSILLVIESPGGTVAGTQELADTVSQVDAKSKPVHAHIDDLGASAAYWAASGARTISANRSALIGSIGAVMIVDDTSKRSAREGVEVIPFVTGPLKAAGASGTRVTPDQRAYFQGMVDSAMEAFGGAVMEGRGFSPSDLAKVASGAVFDSATSLHLGLIDSIASLETAASLALVAGSTKRQTGRQKRAARALALAAEL